VWYYDEIARRNDPLGALIRYEAGSSEPIISMDLDMEGDGEPEQTTNFPVRVGKDGRYNRALAPKFTINGTFPLLMTATDALGRKATVRCTPGITVQER